MENDIITPELVDETLAVWDIRIGQANSLYTYATQEEQAASLHQRNAIMAGLQLGYMLTALKGETPHGQWSSLFSDSPKSLKIKASKTDHNRFFEFSSDKAQKYMSCYRKAVARLEDGQEQSRLDSLLGTAGAQEIVADPHYQDSRDLLSKATGGAESTRQMMLNLGVIKASSAKPKADATYGKSRLASLPAPAQVKTSTVTPEEYDRWRADKARREYGEILALLEVWIGDGLHLSLPRGERDLICDKLQAISDHLQNDK